MPIALSGSLVLSGSITVSGSISSTGGITISGSIASASYAATSSYANTFTVANTLNAQTLVVQTITSSVSYLTGSTQHGQNTGNTHQFTGSVLVSGSQTTNGNVTAGNGTTSVSLAINRGAAGNSNGLRFQTAGTNNWYIGSAATGANTNLEIYNHNTALTNLLLDYSTGAATFASSVNTGGPITVSYLSTNGQSNIAIKNTETTGNYNSAGLQLHAYDGSSVAIGTSLFHTFNGFSYQQIGGNQTNLYGMKSGGLRLATVAAPIIFANGSSDADFSVARMYIASGGNVGIGNTSPQTRLDITSTGGSLGSSVTYPTDTNGIVLRNSTNSSNTGSGIWFDHGGLQAGIASARANTGDWGTDIRFFTHPTSTSNQYILQERMRIVADGNVSIGTTNAYTSRLNIQASAANRPAIKAGFGASAGNGYWILGDNYTNDESLSCIGIDYSGGGLVLGSALAPSTTTGGAFISTQAQFGGYGSAIKLNTGGDIIFYNGTQNSVIAAGNAKAASVAMTILQTGNVGIGTSPNYRLHVQDSTNIGTIAIGHTSYPGLIYSSAVSGEFRIDNRSSSSAGYITFYPNGQASTLGTEAMRINQSGNIGIGVTNQVAKLQVRSNNQAAVIFQTGDQSYMMFGKVIQSYGGTSNNPLLSFNVSGNTGYMFKIFIRGTNAVSNVAYEDVAYASWYCIGGGYQNSTLVQPTTVINIAGSHNVGTLSWANVSTAPVLRYSQGSNGYILETIDVYVTARDGGSISFNVDYVNAG